MTKKLLLIEDDKSIAEIERDYLEADGFSVEIAPDGRKGLDLALSEPFDLLLVDVMLPGADGFQICREVRKAKDVPILMVSARREDIDKIRALGLGADDYIVKPFSPGELVARVKAHLARYGRLKNGGAEAGLIFDGLEIRKRERRVLVAGREAALKKREFDLLLFLAENPNIVFSRETIFERVWGLDAMGDDATVTVHVNRVREKIEPNPSKPRYIETVWGAGYRFRG